MLSFHGYFGTIQLYVQSFFIQKFESVRDPVASDNSYAVWWDTRLAAGTGGPSCMGLRLGYNGQIRNLDLSSERKVHFKVGSDVKLYA